MSDLRYKEKILESSQRREAKYLIVEKDKDVPEKENRPTNIF